MKKYLPKGWGWYVAVAGIFGPGTIMASTPNEYDWIVRLLSIYI